MGESVHKSVPEGSISHPRFELRGTFVQNLIEVKKVKKIDFGADFDVFGVQNGSFWGSKKSSFFDVFLMIFYNDQFIDFWACF